MVSSPLFNERLHANLAKHSTSQPFEKGQDQLNSSVITAHPSKFLFVIGVTGTNGKTTVSHLVDQALQQSGYKSFVLGTLNSKDPNLSTPEPQEIYEAMSNHLANGGTHFILEVTSEGIDQGRIAGIDFNVKLLTNITPDHLDYHITFEAYQHVKLSFMAAGNCTKIYPNDFIKAPLGFPIALPGEFNKLNVKAAISILRCAGVNAEAIKSSLTNCKPPQGRMDPVERGQPYSLFIDYAHSHDALQNALNAAREVAQKHGGRVLVLFGCGGDRDKTRRPMMAAVAERLSDWVVITDDNPRSERSKVIIQDILKGFTPLFKGYDVVPNRGDAIRTITSLAAPGDVVLLSGKGHERYQVIGATTHYWNEHEAAALAIDEALINTEEFTSVG